MAPRVKRRQYRSPVREISAADTRRAILAAATDLFLRDGFGATTMAAIAARAGVAVDTVYAAVGTKPAVLRALIENAISGTDRTVAAEDRDYVREIRKAPSASTKLQLYAAAMRRIHERLSPLFVVLQHATDSAPELSTLWNEISDRRASNMRLFAADVASTNQLDPDLSIEEMADVVWATNSPELYLLLVEQRHWPPQRYENWLAGTWQRLFLS